MRKLRDILRLNSYKKKAKRKGVFQYAILAIQKNFRR